MTPEPCPTCKGRCCVNKHGSPAEHGAALAMHSCPDCCNGVQYAPSRPLTNDDLARAYDMGRDMERADTVAWLREEYDTHSTQDAADHIERGEHRRSPSSRPARPRIDPLALPCPACAAPVRKPCHDLPLDAYHFARVEEADGGGVPINPETSK